MIRPRRQSASTSSRAILRPMRQSWTMRVVGAAAAVVLAAGRTGSGQQSAAPAPSPVTGIVVVDANGNGRADAGEQGLADVAVSNGRDVVRTAADGTFSLSSPDSGIVFVSVPDNHDASGPFWRRVGDGDLSFALRRATHPRTFTFLHASDPHVSPQTVARLEQVVRIATERRPAFVLLTGDLVRDALRVPEAEATGYYDLFAKTAAAFPMAVRTVPGNHELFGIERHSSLVSASHPLYGKGMYHQRLGPTYYSFTYGGVHFVGLDTVDIDDLWYYGHVDARQLEWLANDLATIPPSMPIVTFNHIPFVSASTSISGYDEDGAAPTLIRVKGKWQLRHTVSNLADVQQAVGGRPWPLALAGHVHLREAIRVESSVKTRFYQTAAVVGPTTGGPVPSTSGVTFYTVRDGVIDDGEFVPLQTSTPPGR